MPISALLRRLLRDTNGSAAIQFAIVVPAFLAIVVAVLDTACVFLAQNGLETAGESAGRLLMTGQAQQGAMSSSAFKTEACKSLPPYLKCSGLMVDVQTVNSYSAAGLNPPTLTFDSSGNVTNTFSYSPGGQGAIVVVRVMYLWPSLAGPLGYSLANTSGNRRLMIATSVLKSENY